MNEDQRRKDITESQSCSPHQDVSVLKKRAQGNKKVFGFACNIE